jgi:DNA-binding PadR family transcriptional regulator
MGNLYRFVEPVVLYLLKKNGPAYGYELGRALNEHALTDAEIDRGALYRTLQRLETMGHVVSSWDVSGSGPARHVYELTKSGETHLEEWGVVLDNLSRTMQTFVTELKSVCEATDDSTCYGAKG